MASSSVTDKQFDKLVAELKKNPGNSEAHYANATGIPQSKIGSVLYHAELEADPKLKIAGTPKAIAQARDVKKLRWPRIAAYSGLGVAEVKRMYEEQTGVDPSQSWTGRGRKFNGEESSSAKKSGGSGRRQAAGGNKGTSGRRGAAGGKRGGAAAPSRGRRGTRAQASANPK